MADSPVVGTIIAKNYLAHARVLARTIAAHHPDMRVVVLLVDQVEDYFDPAAEPFETWLASDLRIPNWPHMAAKYTTMELCTAAKPFFLQRLLELAGVNKAIYFDPDIAVYHRFDRILGLLDSHLAVLTPHILKPLYDGRLPSELNLLQAGSYNLGFIALSQQGDWRGLLRWWQTRLYDGCYSDIPHGLFVDQRWCDLIPSLFQPVHILREAAYNVAYWNLAEREVVKQDGCYTVDGKPLVFFHFSGLLYDAPEKVSKHQNRFRLHDFNRETRELFLDYLAQLKAASHEEVCQWPYSYGVFEDGSVIPDDFRRRLRNQDPIGSRMPNPFGATASDPLRSSSPAPAEGLAGASPPAPRHPELTKRLEQWQGRVSRVAQSTRTTAVLDAVSRHWIVSGLTTKLRMRLYGANFLHLPAVGHPLAPPQPNPPPAAARPQPVSSPAAARPQPSPALLIETDRGEMGANILGYFKSENGVGQAARNLALSLRAVDFPVATHTLVAHDPARKQHQSENDDTRPEGRGIRHGVSVFCINADMTYEVFRMLGHAAYLGRKNVGLWFWELSSFPERWRDRFAVYDEIWTCSRFVQQSVAACSPIPVRHIPLALQMRLPATVRRSDFGLPEDRLLFLYTLDGNSRLERKNPLAVVNAFRAAFTPAERHSKVQLVIKATNLGPSSDYASRLRRALADVEGILIDGYLDRLQVNALSALCDAYVSLHRSEGFGLTMAEAMSVGKPVIATGYSGNMDFMNESNSYPVPYSLIPIEVADPPYDAGCLWADPDIEAAAAAMRQIVSHPEDARARAQMAARTIESLYNPAAAGLAVKRALQEIEAERHRPPHAMAAPRRAAEPQGKLSALMTLRSRSGTTARNYPWSDTARWRGHG